MSVRAQNNRAMDDEQFENLKEEEREHLRELRSLKQAARLLERQRSITQALEEMTSRSRAVLEENERLVEEIAFDTARQEARLDTALEGMELDPEALAEASEALLREAAREEVNRLKAATTGSDDAPIPDRAQRTPPDAQQAADPLPEKTLGRMR